MEALLNALIVNQAYAKKKMASLRLIFLIVSHRILKERKKSLFVKCSRRSPILQGVFILIFVLFLETVQPIYRLWKAQFQAFSL